MSEPIDRRRFLQAAGATGAVVASGALRPVRTAAAAEPDEALAPFLHGVASGDPLADRVVLWTRVTPSPQHEGAPIPVRWVVARDVELTDVVAHGATRATRDRDWTVKVDPDGLEPGTHYWYAFTALGRWSLVGRTRTAPAGPVERLRFGLVSCSNWEGGYFHAYARLAQRTDLDAVLHLGDYLYEYGQGAYGDGASFGRAHEDPATEMVELADYRGRHAQYKLDPDLRALHQLHPFVTTWDDHEITDNSWRDGAANHQPDTEGPYAARRRAATRAYDEWMPIRTQDPDDLSRIWRSLSYGDLCELIVLDTRLEGRDEQVPVGVLDAAEGPDFFAGLTEIGELGNADRTMMSDDQWAFLTDRLSGSSAQWKIVAQQVMVMPWRVGGVPQPPAGAPDFPPVTTGGQVVNTDAWDGYPYEQRRFLSTLAEHDVEGAVVLTGDIHSSWAADLPLDPYDPSTYDPVTRSGSHGVEFVVPSVTSSSFYQTLGYEYRTGSIAIEQASMLANPHIRYVEGDTHGYCILDITPERVQNQWWHAHHVEDPEATQDDVATAWETRAGDRHLTGPVEPATAPGGDPGAPPATPPDPAPSSDPAAAPAPAPPSTPASAVAGALPATGGGPMLLGLGAIGAAAVLRARRSRPPA